MHKPVFAAGETVDLTGLSRSGLLRAAEGSLISPLAVFVPVDAQGVARPVEIGEGCQVGPFAVIYGGSVLGDGTRLDEHAIVGKPEQGYAVGNTYPGSGAVTVIRPGAVTRAGAIVYAGAEVGVATVVGHHTLLRSLVTVGAETQLGHNLTIERASRIGDRVRCSPGRTYAQINAALLAALTAQRLAETRNPHAQLWGCAIKAHGADVAYQAASELALLTGAAGFTAGSGTTKTRQDLSALLYADGIHDSLYRSAGRSLTQPSSAASPLPVVTAGEDNRVHA